MQKQIATVILAVVGLAIYIFLVTLMKPQVNDPYGKTATHISASAGTQVCFDFLAVTVCQKPQEWLQDNFVHHYLTVDRVPHRHNDDLLKFNEERTW